MSQPIPEEPGDRPSRRWLPRPGTILWVAAIVMMLAGAATFRVSLRRRLDAVDQVWGVYHSKSSFWLPMWVGRRLPESWRKAFVRYHQIELDDATDDSVLLVRGISELKDLRLSSDQFSDLGLQRVGELLDRLPHLKVSLCLIGSQITDDGLASLSGRKGIYSVHVSFTHVTDAGLRHLATLPDLERLWINDTVVTDEGLRRLASLTSLETLDLHRTAVTNDGLKYLATLPNLTDVNLTRTAVTNAGRRSPLGLPGLKSNKR